MARDKQLTYSVVTGASSGIGLELARLAARHGSDLVIAADGDAIHAVGRELGAMGVNVDVVQADLATTAGVDQLVQQVRASGRPLDALFANAGVGLGNAFLDQEFAEIQRVIDTNVTGTTYLLHQLVNDMRHQGFGKVLITGSIAGLMPGSFQAVYNATKAYVDSFSYALRNELEGTGVSVTVLMPGPTDTDFFEAADLENTKVGRQKKDDPADVAKAGFEAMLRGDGHEVSGFPNKLQAMMSRFLSDKRLASMHRKLAEPDSNKRH